MRFPVTYWTGIWEPDREAISKEVRWLRGALAPGAPVVSFTPQRSALLVRERVLRLNLRRWIPLRAAAAAIEPAGAVTHAFGRIDAGHLLYALGRRPMVFTVVIPGAALNTSLYDRVRVFVAESRGLAATLTSAGVDPTRIEIIYPAVDLARYRVSPPPALEPLRILFASSPSDPAELDARGVGLLIELARERPDIELVVLWRRWGDVDAGLRALAMRSPPPNFRVEVRDAADMASVYRGVHATVCCFETGTGKSAPNSVIEGLASGRPALLSDTCGIADVVGEAAAGVIVPRTVDGLVRGVDELKKTYGAACSRARQLAEREFNETIALERYRQLYERVAKSASANTRFVLG